MNNFLKINSKSMPELNIVAEQIILIRRLNSIFVETNDGKVIPITYELTDLTDIRDNYKKPNINNLPLYYRKANDILLYCLEIGKNKLFDIGKWVDYNIEIRNEFTENFNTKPYDYNTISTSLEATINFVERYILKYEKYKTKQNLMNDNISFEAVPENKLYNITFDRVNKTLNIDGQIYYFVRKQSQEFFVLECLFNTNGVSKNQRTSVAFLVSSIKGRELTSSQLYDGVDLLKAVSKLNKKISKYFKLDFNLIIHIKNNPEGKASNKIHDYIMINTSKIIPK